MRVYNGRRKDGPQMKGHRTFWILIAVATCLSVLVLALRGRSPSEKLTVYPIGQSNDQSEVVLVCRITNHTSSGINFGLQKLDAKSETGWAFASNYDSQPARSRQYLRGH